MKYRKRPIVVDAEPVVRLIYLAGRAWADLPAWFVDSYERGEVLILPDGLQVKTLEGWMHANRDSWLIRGIAGELYACAGHIFRETYEPELPGDLDGGLV